MIFTCQSKWCNNPCRIHTGSGTRGMRANAAATAQCPWGHKRGVSFVASKKAIKRRKKVLAKRPKRQPDDGI